MEPGTHCSHMHEICPCGQFKNGRAVQHSWCARSMLAMKTSAHVGMVCTRLYFDPIEPVVMRLCTCCAWDVLCMGRAHMLLVITCFSERELREENNTKKYEKRKSRVELPLELIRKSVNAEGMVVKI